MIGYFFFVFFVLLFAYLGDPKVTSEKTAVFFRCLLVFTLAYMIGLGGGAATDNADYQATFKHMPGFSQLDIDNIGTLLFDKYEDNEYGFVVIVSFLKQIGFTPVGICFVIALIMNFLIVNTYSRFQYPLLIYVLFLSSPFFAQEPNLIRQTLAISIFVFSLRYIEKKDWKKYLLCVLMMFLIHHSSLITLLFLPFCFNINIQSINVHKILKYTYIALWGMSVLIAMGRIAFDLTGLSLLMVGSEGYDAYLTDENRIGTSSLKFNIVYNFIVLVYFFFGKDKKGYNIYVYCFLIGAIIQNVSVQFANFYRMSLYFTVFSPIVISEMVYDFLHDKSSKKVLNLGLTAMIILLYIRSLFISIAANSEYIGKEMNSLFDIF